MKVSCPICQTYCEYENNPNRPFCSERCKLIDLGEWATGNRGIPDDHSAPSLKIVDDDDDSDSL